MSDLISNAQGLNENPNKKRDLLIGFGLLAVLFVVIAVLEQILPRTSMLFTVLKKGAIYALVAVSMNLLNGFTGLFSLGQAGFMMIGAYTYGVLTIPVASRAAVYQYFDGGLIQVQFPFVLAIILAGVAAGIFAFLIGLPVLHLKSDYLAIATLGFAEIMRAIFQWDKLGVITNGSNLIRKYTIFRSTLFPFVVSGICIAIIVLLINSTYGRAFKAIRDDEVAAEAMGINLAHHKRMAFIISSFFAGISGALLAMFQTTIQANQFKSAMTYEILLIVVIGGIGSVTGSCISSFLFIACSEWWLRFLDNEALNILPVHILRPGFRKVVFSVVIMLIVLFYQKGIMGENEFSISGIIKKFKSLKKASKKGESK